MEENAAEMIAEAPQMSFFQRLAGAFFEPTKTFADIDRKPSWIAMFIIMALLGMVAAYVATSHIDTEALMRQKLAAQNMTEEQINSTVAAQQQNPILKNLKYVGLVVAPIAQLLAYLFVAAVFLLLFVLMGSPTTFKKTLAVTVWGMSPPGIVLTLLTILIIYVKNPESLDVSQGVVMSNLGSLVDAKANPVLGSLLGSVDLFSIWTIVLLAIGFAAISSKKMTTKKAAIGIVILWLIYVLGKAGVRAIWH